MRCSTSPSVSCNVGNSRRKAPFVGFRTTGVLSIDADMELSSWSSKLKLRPVELSALIQCWSPAPRRNCTKLLPQRVQVGGRAEPIWKNTPHSKQKAWSCGLPLGSLELTTRSPATKRRLGGDLQSPLLLICVPPLGDRCKPRSSLES